MGMLLYGSELGIPVWYPSRMDRRPHVDLELTAHAGMDRPVVLKVPELLGKLEHQSRGNDGDVDHDGDSVKGESL